MDDVRAVLDAVGSTSTVLLGSHDGCSMAALYAATYPERTRALVLFHPVAHDPALEIEVALNALAALRDGWGTQEFADGLLEDGAPSLYADPKEREWFANWLRVGASPAVAYALNRAWVETDLRNVLPSVRVPTLVFYRQDAPLDLTRNAEEHARDVARQIRGARLMRVSGRDRFAIFLSTEIPDEVERFVAGEAPPEVSDTVLATVLFTDIVGSTERAAELGDRAWRDLLERHHRFVRRELARFRGEEKDTAGDGFFATFDGPARAIRCAKAVVEGVRELGLEVRAGVHTGECEVHEGKVAGLAVVIGARVSATAGAGEVCVSQTVKDLVAGAGIEFEDRGERELKGVPGSWRLYSVAQITD
jgi:class 3 adenylate cyclase